MDPTNKMMAWAQIGLSVLFIVCTFIITALYEMGYAHISADQDKAFGRSLDWLQITCGAIVFFWFNRQRTAGIPDQTQVVTQTHTLPDGTKTVITSPATKTPLSPTPEKS